MRVALLTVSDSVAHATRQDLSGPALRAHCEQLGWKVVSAEVVADDQIRIEARLMEAADPARVDLVLTTGGTGIGPRDVTPEATGAVCTKMIHGIAELMREEGRRKNPRASLSRANAGVRDHVLIVNLPGSPRAAVESFNAIAELLPHAVEVLRGARHD